MDGDSHRDGYYQRDGNGHREGGCPGMVTIFGPLTVQGTVNILVRVGAANEIPYN